MPPVAKRVLVVDNDETVRGALVSVKRVAVWGDAPIIYDQAASANVAIPLLTARCPDWLVIGADASLDAVAVAWAARAQSDTVAIIVRGARDRACIVKLLPPNTHVVASSVEPVALFNAVSTLTPPTLQPEAAIDEEILSLVHVLMKGRRKLPKTLEDLTRTWVIEVVREQGGNKARAAKALGVDRKLIYECLRRYSREAPLR